eukprot:EG_transcript_16921
MGVALFASFLWVALWRETLAADDGPIPVLGVPAFLNTALLERFLASIDHPVEKLVIVHNGRHEGLARLMGSLRAKHPEYVILSHPENLGCAGSWNAIIDVNPQAPYYIIANDDVSFQPGALRTLAVAAQRQVRAVAEGASNRVVLFSTFVNMPGVAKLIWSCFALLRHAVDAVGKFDANLWPAYHEDSDYLVRLSRAGLWRVRLPDVKLFHGPPGGRWNSGLKRAAVYQKNEPTVRLYREQQARHGAGAPYYALKWGRAWTTGVYNNAEGHWDKFCNRTDPTQDCVPIAPRLYPSPFNDSSLPLSVFIFDPVYLRLPARWRSLPCLRLVNSSL